MEKTTHFEFILNENQHTAFSNIQKFLTDKNSQVFILKGYAGTGKTSLVGKLAKWLKENKHDFILLASTGRAAKVLRDKTNENVNTVHSQIYRFADITEDLESWTALTVQTDEKGQLSLAFDLKYAASDSNIVYIIDEASMISDTGEQSHSFADYGSGDLLGDLFRHDPQGKFIFVGDPAQLPPVGQSFSPALSPRHINIKFGKNVRYYELKEVVRQKSHNTIINASADLRKLYTNPPAVKWAKFPLRHHRDIKFVYDQNELISAYTKKLISEGNNFCTMICQTNRQRQILNDLIRSLLHKKSPLETGDLLMITQNNYLTGLVNGDQVEVIKIGRKEQRCDLTFTRVEVKELTSGSKHAVLMIEEILSGSTQNIDKSQHTALLVDFYQRMKAKNIKQKSELFRQEMHKDIYLNALRGVYGYALTCHKAQGGEWEQVFLNLDNKIQGMPSPGIYQWLYTAVTRTKETLILADNWFFV